MTPAACGGTEAALIVLSWGGGVNSTALMIGLADRGTTPDAILFADTLGEYPDTYAYRDNFSRWLEARGLPAIVTVRNTGSKYGSLENECNVKGLLPSPAYGGRSCSIKWKQEPMHTHLLRDPRAMAVWSTGGKVEKLIGYDFGEKRRGELITEDSKYTYRFPLKEWRWDRKACVEAIEAAGLCVPRKSACFFCPAMRKHQVRALAKENPDLFERAIAIEENAVARRDLEGREGGTVGLGRDWTWRTIAKADAAQLKMFHEPAPLPCMCWDGD